MAIVGFFARLFARLFGRWRVAPARLPAPLSAPPPARLPALQAPVQTLPQAAEPTPAAEVELDERALFQAANKAGDSGVRIRAVEVEQRTRRMPALATRESPYDQATRRVDIEEIAREIDARAAASDRRR